MSGKSGFASSEFRRALAGSIERVFGSDWVRLEPDDEAWRAVYGAVTDKELRTISFQLLDRAHAVSVSVGISWDPAVRQPSVWWDDRSKHPGALAFSNVLWAGNRKYEHEKGYHVPREAWSQDFRDEIQKMVQDVFVRSQSWFRRHAVSCRIDWALNSRLQRPPAARARLGAAEPLGRYTGRFQEGWPG
jgi:hypothetical protein